jgi:hypothetical protein
MNSAQNKKFEAWAIQLPHMLMLQRNVSHATGLPHYKYAATKYAWAAWQAALSQSRSSPEFLRMG